MHSSDKSEFSERLSEKGGWESHLPWDFLITGLGGQVSELKGRDGGGVETCVKMLLKPYCSR